MNTEEAESFTKELIVSEYRPTLLQAAHVCHLLGKTNVYELFEIHENLTHAWADHKSPADQSE